MPILVLVVAGVVLLIATTLHTLGWVLIGLGIAIFAFWLLAFVIGLGIFAAIFSRKL